MEITKESVKTLDEHKKMQEYCNEYTLQLKQLSKSYSDCLFNLFKKSIFDNFPNVNSFSWRQYASYWCDGGPCNFYVHEDQSSINGKYCGYGEDLDGLEKEYQAIVAVVGSLNSFMLKTIFGDDQEITFYRDGTVKNEEYGDHE